MGRVRPRFSVSSWLRAVGSAPKAQSPHLPPRGRTTFGRSCTVSRSSIPIAGWRTRRAPRRGPGSKPRTATRMGCSMARPWRGAIRDRLNALSRYDVQGLPLARGGRYFLQKRRVQDDLAILYVRQGRRLPRRGPARPSPAEPRPHHRREPGGRLRRRASAGLRGAARRRRRDRAPGARREDAPGPARRPAPSPVSGRLPQGRRQRLLLRAPEP